jgi:hypothetical protein
MAMPWSGGIGTLVSNSLLWTRRAEQAWLKYYIEILVSNIIETVTITGPCLA